MPINFTGTIKAVYYPGDGRIHRTPPPGHENSPSFIDPNMKGDITATGNASLRFEKTATNTEIDNFLFTRDANNDWLSVGIGADNFTLRNGDFTGNSDLQTGADGGNINVTTHTGYHHLSLNRTADNNTIVYDLNDDDETIPDKQKYDTFSIFKGSTNNQTTLLMDNQDLVFFDNYSLEDLKSAYRDSEGALIIEDKNNNKITIKGDPQSFTFRPESGPWHTFNAQQLLEKFKPVAPPVVNPPVVAPPVVTLPKNEIPLERELPDKTKLELPPRNEDEILQAA